MCRYFIKSYCLYYMRMVQYRIACCIVFNLKSKVCCSGFSRAGHMSRNTTAAGVILLLAVCPIGAFFSRDFTWFFNWRTTEPGSQFSLKLRPFVKNRWTFALLLISVRTKLISTRSSVFCVQSSAFRGLNRSFDNNNSGRNKLLLRFI